MRMSNDKKKTVKKVNRMGLETLDTKIERMIDRGDRSNYLKHLINKAYSLDNSFQTRLEYICNNLQISKQDKSYYLSYKIKF